jgi:hypothetical protein
MLPAASIAPLAALDDCGDPHSRKWYRIRLSFVEQWNGTDVLLDMLE